MRETQRHKDAFEYWLSLGGGATEDSCSKVAEKMEIATSTFWNWYKAFNWRNRADIRLNARAKKIEEKTDNAVVDRKAKELAELDDIDKILQVMIKETVVRRPDGKLGVSIDIEDARDMSATVSAVDKIKKLKQLLIGEDTERVDSKVQAFMDIVSANTINNEPIDENDDEE